MAMFSPRVQKWRNIAVKNPRGWVEERILIPNRMGVIVPFKYKWAQRQYSELKQQILNTGRPLRLWVMKWRRCGMSSVETAESLAQAWGRDNARVAILAHQEERAKGLLENYKQYIQSLETHYPWMKIERSKDNVFGIKFEGTNSQVLIGTAQNPVKIRGDGIHILQGTEAAHWYSDFRKCTREICPVVPAWAGSQIIYESTGTVRGSDPCNHYYDAVPYEEHLKGKKGNNEFIRKFFCWLDDPEETKPFDPALGPIEYQYRALLEEMYVAEPRLVEKNAHYKLTPEQVHMSWEMYNYLGDHDFDYFSREFPYCEDDAWSSGSVSYFGNYELGMAQPEDPIAIYRMDKHNLCKVFDHYDDLEKITQYDDYEDNYVIIKIWRHPRTGEKYLLGADSAPGDGNGDFSSGYMINMHTREMMASYHGRIRPDEAAHINVSLCKIYNRAMAAPETNWGGGGAEALNMMQRLGYNYIYTYRCRDGIKGVELTQKLGWWTKSSNRDMMLGELRKLFLDCIKHRIDLPGLFRDKSLLNEMRTFSRGASGRVEAIHGCFDDRVISLAIAHQCAADETICTKNDLVHRYQKLEKARPIVDPQAQQRLMTKVSTPDKALRALMDPRSDFNKNRFEI